MTIKQTSSTCWKHSRRYTKSTSASDSLDAFAPLEKAGKSTVQNSGAIIFLKPFGFLDYVKLQMHVFSVLSDSETVTEESSILNFPAVTIRQAQEQPEGMSEGTLIMCGLKSSDVIGAVEIVNCQNPATERRFRLVQDYEADNVSNKVQRIILSYTDYVNRAVLRQ